VFLVLEGVADQEVGVHPSRENREFAVSLGFLRDVRIEGEAADDQDIEADAGDGFLGGFLDLLGRDGPVLGADRHSNPAGIAIAVGVVARGVNPSPGMRLQAVELEPLVLERVLHPRLPQVVEDHRREVGSARVLLADQFGCRSFLIGRDDAVG